MGIGRLQEINEMELDKFFYIVIDPNINTTKSSGGS